MDDRAVAIVLAGGQGSRIRSLRPDVPKPLVSVAGEPFIEWIIRHLASQGIGQFVISLGYLADVAERHFHQRAADHLTIRTVREQQPLGTAGAVRWAQQQRAAEADPLIIVNGDSLVLAELAAAWQLLADERVDGVVLGIEVDDAARYGRIDVDGHDRLRRFSEKQPGAGLINAGVYCFRRRVLQAFPARRPLSMELDVFPQLLDSGFNIAVARCRAPFIDIGTPETLCQADAFIERHFKSGVPS
jgi:NDP-sugar pyrophosphorylase family protein